MSLTEWGGPNNPLNLTGAALSVLRSTMFSEAAPAAYPYRSGATRGCRCYCHALLRRALLPKVI